MKKIKPTLTKTHYILITIALITIISSMEKPTPQTVVPSCFEKEDCRPPIQIGYCDVEYDCIIGKCYSEQINCPEACNTGKDEDMDGDTDCDDTDCWSSPYCHCSLASFSTCYVNRCYCSENEHPRWVVQEATSFCACLPIGYVGGVQ